MSHGNIIVLATPDDADLAQSFPIRHLEAGRRGSIDVRNAGPHKEQQTVVLLGASTQDALYLVDYLLDLAWDPVHGRWPCDDVVKALQVCKEFDDLQPQSAGDTIAREMSEGQDPAF